MIITFAYHVVINTGELHVICFSLPFTHVFENAISGLVTKITAPKKIQSEKKKRLQLERKVKSQYIEMGFIDFECKLNKQLIGIKKWNWRTI